MSDFQSYGAEDYSIVGQASPGRNAKWNKFVRSLAGDKREADLAVEMLMAGGQGLSKEEAEQAVMNHGPDGLRNWSRRENVRILKEVENQQQNGNTTLTNQIQPIPSDRRNPQATNDAPVQSREVKDYLANQKARNDTYDSNKEANQALIQNFINEYGDEHIQGETQRNLYNNMYASPEEFAKLFDNWVIKKAVQPNSRRG